MGIKIAIVRPNIIVQKLNFYNSQELGLAKALAALGYDVDVVSVGNNNKDVYTELNLDTLGKVRYINLMYKKLPVVDLVYFPNFEKFLSNEDYDFIHVNEYNELVSYQTARYCTKNNIPMVVYQGVYRPMRSRALKLYQYFHKLFMLPTVLKAVQVALTKSTLAENYLHSCGVNNTAVMPVGLDVSKFNESSESSTLLSKLNKLRDGGKFLVTYVGDFSERRNIRLLLDIVNDLRDSKVCFMFAGNGALFEYATEQKDELGLDNLLLPGALPQSDLPTVYTTSDIFILASDYEIYGMVLLEAMYFGNAILSTPTAGAVDLIGKSNGFLVDTKSSTCWSKYIQDLTNNPVKLKDFQVKNKLKIQSELTWDKIALKYKRDVLDPIFIKE